GSLFFCFFNLHHYTGVTVLPFILPTKKQTELLEMQKMLAIMFCNLNPANIRPICAQNAFSSIYHDIARRMQFPRNFRLTVFQHTLVDCKAFSLRKTALYLQTVGKRVYYT
ncbi:MAG: hypothetical protein ACI4LZ_07820, partial [Anaerovoracaceae bacterium]